MQRYIPARFRVGDDDGGSSGSPAQQTETPSPMEDNERRFSVDQLQSREHAVLLDAIDRLRQEHIDADISIPQIVVCGNQSSGKSSVLEAIAGVAFPIGAGTTTRFATEVVLRRDPEDRKKARLMASSEFRPSAQRALVESFQRSFEPSDSVDFGRVIKEAEDHLVEIDGNAGFWKDWLRIEISGPSQVHLTLVDLPGIIQYEREGQGNEQRILDLLNSYVENRRTTVLAIIDGLNDYQNQRILDIITTTARDRTVGVITKSDRLESGSDHLRNVMRLVRNESVPLRLGWHALSNLPHEEDDRTSARRDEVEHQVFAGRDWFHLPRRDVGIESLRSKLRTQLLRSIIVELPDLITEMRQKRGRCQLNLDQLGPSRNTVSEQRTYLSGILNSLSRLIEAALDGDYERSEFEQFFDGSADRGLRDRITDETTKFVREMRSFGKQYHICINPQDTGNRLANDHLENLEDGERPNFSAPFTNASSILPDGNINVYNVHLKAYCIALARHMRATCGRSLPGMPSTKTIRAIFRQLSVPWASIVDHFTEDCCNAVQTFLTLAIRHVAGEHTGDALLRAYVYPNGDGYDRRRSTLEAKIGELLWPYKHCHPITYHPSFNPRSALESYSDSARPETTWAEIARTNEYRANLTEAADALDQAESYYNIAMNTFVENVACLGVEKCLLHDLSNLISPAKAITLGDDQIRNIAAESAEVMAGRTRAETQKAALDEVIAICRSYIVRESTNGSAVLNVPPELEGEENEEDVFHDSDAV